MSDLTEARKNLDACLDADLKRQYFALLREWFTFKMHTTKIQFDIAARRLCRTEEQCHYHNQFMLALFTKVVGPRAKSARGAADKGSFELADYTEYMPPSSPTMMAPTVDRSAASEFFLPDSGFVAAQVELRVWENGLDGADKNVAEYLVIACQMYIKSILTAMISKKESYRLKDKRFQYGFGLPVQNPILRNTHNIVDHMQESRVDIKGDDDIFPQPTFRPTIETAEQQAAFSYACGKRSYSGDKLTLRLVYDTLREDPNIVGLHSINSINLLKIGLQLKEP